MLFAVTVEITHILERLPQQVGAVAQDAALNLVFPGFIKTDLHVEPVFQPFRIGQARLDGAHREQRFIHVQVGEVQHLAGPLARRHQEADLGEPGGNANGKERTFAITGTPPRNSTRVCRLMRGLARQADAPL